MEEERLWTGPAPGSEGWTHRETAIGCIPGCPGAVRNVVVPTVTRYPSGKGTDHAVVVVPGGGFRFLSMENEGHEVARYLVERGLDAYVLKYRVAPTPGSDDDFGRDALSGPIDGVTRQAINAVIPLSVIDARRAMERARQDGHRRVSVVGFSAGARITAELATSGGADRPNAAGVIYSPRFAAGPASAELPPLFLAVAGDDAQVGTDGTLSLYDLWVGQGRPVELHLFERGGHGFGMRQDRGPAGRWASLFVDWLHLHAIDQTADERGTSRD